ncbi:MAG: glycine zipper 2TM domain-containing protein [Nitrospirae bacterium]|nr:glycine zipper 2TM domain-containing protein [Nitrospirota bacterium]
MKKITSFILVISLLGLSWGCAPHQRQGTAAGAAVGGISGAILDSRNPWRGGIIGGVIGAIVGATISDISYRAAQEAAQHDRPVEYRTEDGRGLYRAEPLGYNERTRCKRIHERVWEDGRLVRDREREICEERYDRPERRY